MNNKMPSIRFKSFKDPWHFSRFGQLVEIERGGSPRPIQEFITEADNGLNWVKIGDAPKFGNKITKTEEKIKPEGLNKTREVHPGDLILSNSMSFGKPYIMGINGCIHDGWLLIRNNKDVFSLDFLCSLLGTPMMLNQYKALAAGSTVNNLNKQLVSGADILYPEKKEQIKIGIFLEKIDGLIELQQSRHILLNNFKNSLLNGMFPNRDEDSPKIRFSDFDEAWKKETYSSIGSPLTGGSLSYDDLNEYGSYKCVLYGELYTKYDSVISNITNRTDKIATPIIKNDILFPSSTTVDAMSLISPACMNDDEAQTGGVFVIRPCDGVDGNFVSYYTKGNIDQKYKLSTKAQGLTIIHLYYQSIKDETIFMPSYKEQKKISTLLMKIDSLIEKSQQRIELLKSMKSSLLCKMFPN